MAIKVQIPAGESNVTVSGLYQWDYGQVLEIECIEFGSEVLEAHFACSNMAEAVVRTCTFTTGVGTVEIPDECLEQASAVTVWLCRRDSTQRHTIKTIVLPLTARTRPGNMLDDVPASRVDAVGQLIEEVNEAINALENGSVVVAKATTAKNATYATEAGSAKDSTLATKANGLSHLYLHQITISIPVSASETNAINDNFSGNLVYSLHLTDPSNTININTLVERLLKTQINSVKNMPGSYVPNSGTIQSIEAYVFSRGENAYGAWQLKAYINIGGSSYTTYYAKTYSASVITTQIY